MTLFRRLLSMIALLVLAACGGAGGDGGSPFGGPVPGGDGGGGGGTASATDLVLVLSSPTIASTGAETVVATATALDANRNALANVPVSISVDNGGVATTSGTATGTGGTIVSTIGIGADSSVRTITVTASSGSLVRTAPLRVQEGASSGLLPTLDMALSSPSISSAAPATVTATLRDAQNAPLAGQVVGFSVARGLAVTNVGTALTRDDGTAVVILSPASSTGAGADEVVATATVAGAALRASRGFTVQATNVTISRFTSAVAALGAYGQTSLEVGLDGASIGSPVQVTVTSACVTAGKATLSPTRFTATTATVTLQYRDIGCGALQAADSLQAVIDGSASTASLALPIASPSVSSLAFISSTPEQIYLKGSGFAESSSVVFEVRDANGSPLPNVNVVMRLLTLTGGVTMDGATVDVVRASDALGRVTVRVNSGTLPTPVRVAATLQSNAGISTVSSNLSVAVGLPSQLNFSLSQGTRNIEGYNIDGVPNTYQIIAADRSGNPVPAGTSINFVTEGGQVEAIKQTQIVAGIARTVANFVSAEPRPVDGRVTITSYALGEESFLDTNGNNVRDAGESFQDLGNIFKDRNFDGHYDAVVDEYVPLEVNNSSACAAPGNDLLQLDPSIPSMDDRCDGNWSGAGQVYVRRATETVLSTSAARPLWGNRSGLDASCQKITLQIGPNTTQTDRYTLVAGGTWYGDISDTLSFIVADANPGSVAQGLPPRLNPMAAGTVISASTPTSGLTVTLGGGSPVASTTEASLTAVAYSFTDITVNSGIIFVTFRSPSGTGTSVSIPVVRAATRRSDCDSGQITPSNLSATAKSAREVQLTWSDSNVIPIDFNIERKVDSGSWSVIATVESSTASYSDTSAQKSTKYTYRIRAITPSGDAIAGNEDVVTTPPALPSDLSASALSADKVQLKWSDSNEVPVDFDIQRKDDSGDWLLISTVKSDKLSYEDASTKTMTKYTYRVRVVTSTGDVFFSNEDDATTQ